MAIVERPIGWVDGRDGRRRILGYDKNHANENQAKAAKLISSLETTFGSVIASIAWVLGLVFGATCCAPAVLLLILMVKTAIENQRNSPDRRGFPIEPRVNEPPDELME